MQQTIARSRQLRHGQAGFYGLAGSAALLAVATLVVAGVALALYFGGVADIFGPVNDIFTALTLLLTVPAVEAVRRLGAGAGWWVSPLSGLTVAGLLIAALGSILLVGGVISLGASFATFGVGMLPLLAWLVGLVLLSLRHGVVKRAVGWWVIAFLTVTVVALLALPFMSMLQLSLTLAPMLFATLAGWLIALGRDLRRRAQAA